MYINSPVGVITSGFGILDTMNYIKPDVATICMGQAASMAAVLLSAGAKGKRSALENSRVMIHQPLGGASGQASDIQIRANEIIRIKKELTEAYVKHNTKGKTYEEFESAMDRDNFMTAQEALDFGLVDEIISNRT